MNTSLIKFYNGTCVVFIADMALNFDCFNCFYNKICTAGLCITCLSPEKECMLKAVLRYRSCLKEFWVTYVAYNRFGAIQYSRPDRCTQVCDSPLYNMHF